MRYAGASISQVITQHVYCHSMRQTISIEVPFRRIIRVSVDALCRDDTSEISRDPGTKRHLTPRERLVRP